MLFRHRVTSAGQSADDGSQHASFLAVGRPGDRARRDRYSRGGFPWLRQWDVHTLKPRSMRELLSLCHRSQLRPCEGRRLQQWRQPLRPSPPGKDRRLHDPLPPNGSRRPAYAQGGLRGDGAQRPGLPGQEQSGALCRSKLLLCVPWALPSSCRFMDRRSTTPRWRTRFAGSSFTTRTAIESSPPRRDDAAFREHVYNQQSRAVVLRLYLLAKPKSSYFVHRETLENPSASRPPQRPSRSARHECRDSSGPGRECEGHGRQVLQGSGRYVLARPRTPSRRTGQAMGSPRGKPGHVLSHARLEQTRGLAYGAVFHAIGVRALLANARPGSPCEKSSSDTCGATGCPIRLAATRTASRPTCSCFVGASLVFWNISRRRSRRSEPTQANTAIKLFACDQTDRHLPKPMSRSA